MKKNIIIGIGTIIAITVLIVTSLSNNSEQPLIQNNELEPGIRKAAIIDQLHDDKPNEKYQKTITKYLEDAGYQVDLYTTKEITVNFYKFLPSMNYEFIVFRSHALGVGTVEESASLFTGELYAEDKYLQEQYAGQVGKGVPYLPKQVEERGGLETLTNQTYFVVGSRLVDDLMVGEFPNSVLVLGGCETVEGTILANSLLEHGASEVIGWNGLVSSGDNDRIISSLLKKTLVNGTKMADAVQLVMKENQDSIRTSAKLEYHSSGAIDENNSE